MTNNQYLSLAICQKLEALGVKANGEIVYIDGIKMHPRHIFSDIMTKDALVKVFGEEPFDYRGLEIDTTQVYLVVPQFKKDGSWDASIDPWQYYRTLLAEAYSEEGIEGCEKVLEGVLDTRKEAK